MTKNLKYLAYPISVAMVIILPVFILGLLGYRFNFSPSMPIGIWKTDSTSQSILKGKVVLTCLPHQADIYNLVLKHNLLPKGLCDDGTAPLLKPVAAIGSDIVVIDNQFISVNDQVIINSTALEPNKFKVNLPLLSEGKYIVNEDEVWLISKHHTHSLDSRYFGAIGKENIIAVMQPVWVWGK
ncbi:hypothetical protein NF27_DT00330 [Candidatus Jidaibacter acanthamoeba]|uniref:Peptidase S26 domain-containing protein n=1 Tax=Candidatus Jidaibacter acanthamoebae TaxID=86105 RepID=A0A0C1QID6_9RICK|nr:conjugative transfer signal peptidase TraF [Candidatus Jidaibacter acanthamoeba]KIE05259.1 hypothetical protein NF27_DT00330 [Candidatus Jidaibacter acanthamoeba]